MRNWEAFVRQHLSVPDLRPEREERIVRELASQLEDLYHDAVSRGMSGEEAEGVAERQIRDWECLASEIRRADRPHLLPRIDRWADSPRGSLRQKVLRALTDWMWFDPSAPSDSPL